MNNTSSLEKQSLSWDSPIIPECHRSFIKLFQGLSDITNYLADNKFTYTEAKEFVECLSAEIESHRRDHGFDTYHNYVTNNSYCDIDNKVIHPWNRINMVVEFAEIFGYANKLKELEENP